MTRRIGKAPTELIDVIPSQENFFFHFVELYVSVKLILSYDIKFCSYVCTIWSVDIFLLIALRILLYLLCILENASKEIFKKLQSNLKNMTTHNFFINKNIDILLFF